MSQSQVVSHKHPRRRFALISAVLLIGLLIVFRDTPLVLSLEKVVLALLDVAWALIGLLTRIVWAVMNLPGASPIR